MTGHLWTENLFTLWQELGGRGIVLRYPGLQELHANAPWRLSVLIFTQDGVLLVGQLIVQSKTLSLVYGYGHSY